jgi:hypothetical protein
MNDLGDEHFGLVGVVFGASVGREVPLQGNAANLGSEKVLFVHAMGIFF